MEKIINWFNCKVRNQHHYRYNKEEEEFHCVFCTNVFWYSLFGEHPKYGFYKDKADLERKRENARG